MKSYWFEPKRYGYGATPINWKGWVAVLGFIFTLLFLSFVILPFSRVVFFIVFFVLTIFFIWLSKVKTNAEWKWRWGR